MTWTIKAAEPLPLPPADALEGRDDPRARVFCAPGGPEVFYPVAHSNDIWRPDPFDVETIHAEAREVFQRLVGRAAATPRPASGRILLLKGESGSGKTHLMRAFRNWVHEGGRGYCGYMQMTSAAEDYGRYVLSNLIESLSRPYYEPHGETTGLMRLSTSLAESSRFIPTERLAQLREDDLDPACLGRLVDALADQLVQDERFNNFDLDLIRALLYLQRDDPSLRGRVLKYLRCEDLSPADRHALGELTPRTYSGAAERVVALFGQLMGAIEALPLILCLDQLEGIKDHGDAKTRFPRAMSTVCKFADLVPSSVVVVSCLEDLYLELGGHLPTPVRYRLEHDPKPILLSVKRRLPEVEQLIARRLEALYEPEGVAIDEADPTAPIPADELPALSNLPTRLILDWCREFRDRCIVNGVVVTAPTMKQPVAPEPGPDTIRLEQLWNDARTGSVEAVPTDDFALTRLLRWAIAACSDETRDGHRFQAETDGLMIGVEHHFQDQSCARMLIGVCNKSAKGGGLGNQISEIEKRTKDVSPAVAPVIVRSSEFPTSPNAIVSKQLGRLVARGGRRVVVQDADWRAIQAMRAFRERHQADPSFPAWLAEEKPLRRLEALRKILALDDMTTRPPTPPVVPPEPPPVKTEPELSADAKGSAGVGAGPLVVGMTAGISPERVEVDPAELAMHAAFLGASGSGKTTVALSIVEQLLSRGIPAILIDRKGDLCRYADPAAWAGPTLDAASDERRAALRDRVEVAVYTPGNPEGRPLSIAAVPSGLGGLSSSERAKTALHAASALGGMMNYKATGDDQVRAIILSKAMDLLSQVRPQEVITLPELIAFIDVQDPALVHAIGRLDIKHFKKLVQDLETIRHSRGDLLSAQGEPMDAEALLGLGDHAKPGKTRLSIISTKFLGPGQDVQFWVAQFLMGMARWASRAPSKALQAVLLFDEADLYLPAIGKPPTKEPMENLLKRGRSAGLGLLLATQSPGDFDYKCRDNIRSWFVGRVTQATALAKMRPMLTECRVDVESRLPGQSTGQFHLLRDGDATSFRADRSLVATEQLSEAEILAVARQTRKEAGSGL